MANDDEGKYVNYIARNISYRQIILQTFVIYFKVKINLFTSIICFFILKVFIIICKQLYYNIKYHLPLFEIDSRNLIALNMNILVLEVIIQLKLKFVYHIFTLLLLYYILTKRKD